MRAVTYTSSGNVVCEIPHVARKMWDKLDKLNKPSKQTIDTYVNSQLWDELCGYIEKEYKTSPVMEYSGCSVPGWNVKYKKAGRSLCTLYPMEGFFTALVVIGQKEKQEAELALPAWSDYVQDVYRNTKEGMGQRWLMLDVKDKAVLQDVKTCISIRRKQNK